MRSFAIFLVAFCVGGAISRCTTQEQQVADRALHDVCRVVTYDTDGGDPLRELARAVDEIERLRRDGGAR